MGSGTFFTLWAHCLQEGDETDLLLANSFSCWVALWFVVITTDEDRFLVSYIRFASRVGKSYLFRLTGCTERRQPLVAGNNLIAFLNAFFLFNTIVQSEGRFGESALFCLSRTLVGIKLLTADNNRLAKLITEDSLNAVVQSRARLQEMLSSGYGFFSTSDDSDHFTRLTRKTNGKTQIVQNTANNRAFL